MRRLRSLLAGMLCLLIAAPAIANAQAHEDGDGKGEDADFVRDVLWAILGPNWNVFANAGATTNGRFLLQDLPGGQRSLRSDGGWNVGLGAGVNFLLHSGIRFSYTYSKSDLKFRTDNGNGTENLNVDDNGRLMSHTAAVEVLRYMLPPRAMITPYGSVGFLGTWWVLDEESALIEASGGSTQFRFGALASFGFQMRVSDHFSTRLELASGSVRNPFTGKHSFGATDGFTIDEPTRVNQSNWRLVGVYEFGKRKVPSVTAEARRRRNR
jgi:opacity protein-like surface antigen